MWVAQSGVPSGDREDDCLSRMIVLAVKFDGLNISNLACFQLARRQLIAEAHAYSPSSPSYEAADPFLETGRRPGGAINGCPVSTKLHQERHFFRSGGS